jgi:4-amino-4-deoxy-L-arabinose transferase-like glycosyltransferase
MQFAIPRRYSIAALLLILLLGFFVRVRGLNQLGFNDDEINKVEAARSYLRGDFSPNREHPMLMKAAVAISLAAADFWNRHTGTALVISEEVSVRLPNVLCGSLTALALFFFAEEFFGTLVGLVTALLWSFSPITLAINRIAKEDTLLVLFAWLGYYLYLRARRPGAIALRNREKYYAGSGISFGLMLASKYFPHYYGLNFLYSGLIDRKSKNPLMRPKDTILTCGAFVLVFILANPIILLPSTLRYMIHFISGETVVHHGYLMMGHLYNNNAAFSHGGMPSYLYLLLFAVKTPFPVLVVFFVGMIEVFRRWREPGPFFILLMFFFWIIPFSIPGEKWFRYMLAWMPTVIIIAAVGTEKIFSWVSKFSRVRIVRRLVPVLVAILACVFLLEPAWSAVKSAPFYTLYLNAIGGKRIAYYFPHDEMNDLGLREAIKVICEEAPAGAQVGGEAEAVFRYYFEKFGRKDLRFFSLSARPQGANIPKDSYFVIQDGRKYFENVDLAQRIESSIPQIRTIYVEGAVAARVYQQPAIQH